MNKIFLLLFFTTLFTHAEIKVHVDYHDNFEDLRVMQFDGSYIIDIPEPDHKGVSTLYLSAHSHEIIFNTFSLNNISQGLAVNSNLQGRSAKTIQLVFQGAESITFYKELSILGQKADLEIIGLKEFVCNLCSFEGSDSVIVRTGKINKALETEGDGYFTSYSYVAFEGAEFHIFAKEIEFHYPIDNSYKLFLNFYKNTVIDKFIAANSLSISTSGDLKISENASFEGNDLVIKSNNVQVEYGAQFLNYDSIRVEANEVLINHAYINADNIYIKADEIYVTTGPYYKQYGDYTVALLNGSPYILYVEPETVTWDGDYVMYKKTEFAVPAYDIEKMLSEKAVFQASNFLEIDSKNIYNFYGIVSANRIKTVAGIHILDNSKPVASLEKVQILCYSKEHNKSIRLPKNISRCSDIEDINHVNELYEPKWTISGPSFLMSENAFLTP